MLDINKTYKDLKENIEENKILLNEKMSKHTSFKIGGEADIFVKANTIEDIKHTIQVAKSNNVPIYILGNGSNLLVKDEGVRGVVLNVRLKGIQIEKKEKEIVVKVGAGVKIIELANRLLKDEISGFEFASGIPGTIGGAVKMNAGAYGGEMKDFVVSTTYINIEDGNIYTINNQEHEFEYRHSLFVENKFIILETKLKLNIGNKEEIQAKMQEYKKQREEKQPINFPNAGSTFKRGDDFITAKLIDECGLKGYTIGDAMVSDKHAGFVVNTGNATADDVLNLIEHVKKVVYEKTGKRIQLEIEIW